MWNLKKKKKEEELIYNFFFFRFHIQVTSYDIFKKDQVLMSSDGLLLVGDNDHIKIFCIVCKAGTVILDCGNSMMAHFPVKNSAQDLKPTRPTTLYSYSTKLKRLQR